MCYPTRRDVAIAISQRFNLIVQQLCETTKSNVPLLAAAPVHTWPLVQGHVICVYKLIQSLNPCCLPAAANIEASVDNQEDVKEQESPERQTLCSSFI